VFKPATICPVVVGTAPKPNIIMAGAPLFPLSLDFSKSYLIRKIRYIEASMGLKAQIFSLSNSRGIENGLLLPKNPVFQMRTGFSFF
ncbi:MAG: hypothetical protein JSW15_08200, partial [Deltaproteobacteria bacterium]